MAKSDPFPSDSPGAFERLHQIQWFWEELGVGERPEETMLRELEFLKDGVTAALRRVPMDITTAECLTAYAMLVLQGTVEF